METEIMQGWSRGPPWEEIRRIGANADRVLFLVLISCASACSSTQRRLSAADQNQA